MLLVTEFSVNLVEFPTQLRMHNNHELLNKIFDIHDRIL